LAQYNPQIAIGAVQNAEEVRAAMRKLNVHVPPTVISILVQQPGEGLPHLPTRLTNVTVDEALDEVATTFEGIVLYGACTQPRLFDLDFTGGYGFDDRWLNEK
jgi:hypothetical protein